MLIVFFELQENCTNSILWMRMCVPVKIDREKVLTEIKIYWSLLVKSAEQWRTHFDQPCSQLFSRTARGVYWQYTAALSPMFWSKRVALKLFLLKYHTFFLVLIIIIKGRLWLWIAGIRDLIRCSWCEFFAAHIIGSKNKWIKPPVCAGVEVRERDLVPSAICTQTDLSLS